MFNNRVTGWTTALSRPRPLTKNEMPVSNVFFPFSNQHNRFVLDCKDKEPDVLFVGDSMVQLMQQYEVKVEEEVGVGLGY